MARPKTTPDTPLPPRQQHFVAEYLVDQNGKAAAIRAGYSPRSAQVKASRMLDKPQVAAAAKCRAILHIPAVNSVG